MPAKPARMTGGLPSKQQAPAPSSSSEHQHHHSKPSSSSNNIRITHVSGDTIATSTTAQKNNNNHLDDPSMNVGTMTLPAGMTMEMIKQQMMSQPPSSSSVSKNNNNKDSNIFLVGGNNNSNTSPNSTNNNRHHHKTTTFVGNPNLPHSTSSDGFVVVANGKLRVGKDGIVLTDPDNTDIPAPSVKIEDLVEEKILDKTNDTVVAVYRRKEIPASTSESDNTNNTSTSTSTSSSKKERYAVKTLQIKNKRDTLHIVAAEVGAAYMNRSDFTVTLKNAYLRGSELILIMEYMDGRSLFDLLQNLHEVQKTMKEDAVAFVTHRILLALRMLHEGCFVNNHGKHHSRNISGGSSSNSSFAVSPAGAASPLTVPGGAGKTTSPSSSAATISPQQQQQNSKRVVHRDIKPSNILLNSSGAVKLADFGVAGSTDSIGLATFVGTVNYMCPERIQGRGYNTPSDIWSLGVVVAEMLLGYHPFLASPASSLNSNGTPPNSGTNSGMNSLHNGPSLVVASNVSPSTNFGNPQFPGAPNGAGPGGMMMMGGAGNDRSGMNSGGGGSCVGFCELFERVTKCSNYSLGNSFTEDANDFVRRCLQQDPDKRPSAVELVKHPWIARFGDTCSICPRSVAEMNARMMSNSASSFFTAGGGPTNSTTFGNSQNTNQLLSAENNNNNGTPPSPSVNNSMMTPGVSNDGSTSATTTATSSASVKPPMDSNDFAHYVYEIRKDARDREAEKRRAERKQEVLRKRQQQQQQQQQPSSTSAGAKK